MKKSLLITSLIILLILPVSAFKLENLIVKGDFHIGLVNGIGSGLNFGVRAEIPFESDIELGLELEQLVTDVNYSATINGLKLGAVFSYQIMPVLGLNLHIGTLGFKSNKDIFYKNNSGQTQIIRENSNTTGQYYAISLDYAIWDLEISPKYIINNVTDKGQVTEFDLNLGKSF